MPVPLLSDPNLAAFLQGLEDRVAALENPQSPSPLFPMASADLSVANAALYPNTAVLVTDLLVIGYSSGVHWHRTDTGAVIV